MNAVQIKEFCKNHSSCYKCEFFNLEQCECVFAVLPWEWDINKIISAYGKVIEYDR